MINRLRNYLVDLRSRQQMNIALSKGATMMGARKLDLAHPETWEFSGFSQNGEDGILEVLRGQLTTSNRYFIEIGSADGMQNNSSWLVVAEQYDGLTIDGNAELVKRAQRSIQGYSIGVECLNMFVNPGSIPQLRMLSRHLDPDVFSLDIDGVDYHVARAILGGGFRPKIFVVEYNSVYGPQRSMTIPYQDNFVFTKAHPTHLYYGVSVSAWRKFFEGHGYRFVTVDRKGVNAFFVDPACFAPNFLDRVNGCQFAENVYQRQKFKGALFQEQFSLIADQKFHDV